jgi:hypothetical protein
MSIQGDCVENTVIISSIYKNSLSDITTELHLQISFLSAANIS